MSNYGYMAVAGLIAVGLVGVLSACEVLMIQGSGNITTETRAVTDFDEVNFTNIGELTIVQGNSESLTVTTDDNILPYVKTTVNGGTLTISFDRGTVAPLVHPTQGIHYQLAVKNLKGITLSGAGTVTAAKLETEDLTLAETGAGQIKIDEFTGHNLNANLSGAGRIEVAGKVASQSVVMSGFGSYDAENLQCQVAKVVVSGAGTTTLWVTESLDATISGVGNVRYYGSPQIHSQATGVGHLQSLGNK
jgi:hypothetical protein